MNLLLSEEEEITIETQLPEAVTAPVEPGTIIGNIHYYLEGELIRIYPVTAVDAVEAVSPYWCLKQTFGKYYL